MNIIKILIFNFQDIENNQMRGYPLTLSHSPGKKLMMGPENLSLYQGESERLT